MISYAKGTVKSILSARKGVTEIEVEIGRENFKAINYDFLTGQVAVGDSVLLNTTAQDLKLGSGGYHFVVSVNCGEGFVAENAPGHIMKLRYTPLQFAVLSAEEEDSPYHSIFNNFSGLGKKPVIIGELHSMVAPAVFGVKRNRPKLKVSYIMTDGGALPLSFSKAVKYLKENNLIDGTVTYGQAFGGDIEAVNIYTALISAFEILHSDVAVVAMGPGITGTGTEYGFSGIEQGPIIDAVNNLGGLPIFIPRISFADKRKRHCGISHHSITVLNKVAMSSANIVVPKFSGNKFDYIQKQIDENTLNQKHKIIYVDELEKLTQDLLSFDFKLSTMGRGIDKDAEFFITAAAAGYYASSI
ncbi:DUF3866 family protein [Tepidanaerobacter syntrophicus]|uniref:DUF3866 family protein n=1 Tax=Tepidanaerobacter syntrophicus TaxID=224999 RepID=UPI001BD4B056|nr:DUF3866 family protein [Tepidanaerobacter syntrophicus]